MPFKSLCDRIYSSEITQYVYLYFISISRHIVDTVENLEQGNSCIYDKFTICTGRLYKKCKAVFGLFATYTTQKPIDKIVEKVKKCEGNPKIAQLCHTVY